MKIVVSPDYVGFIAVDEDEYDGPDSFLGWGRTEQEAIDDLMEQLED